MTVGMLAGPRWAITALAIGGLLLTLLGWQSFGNLIDLDDQDEPALSLSVQQRDLAAALEQLRGDDGLFMASRGATARPGLYESAHGMTALREATGRKVPLVPGPAVLRESFSRDLDREPFASLILLSQIERASGEVLHAPGDGQRLLQARGSEGYFQEPGFEAAADVSTLLADTAKALDALGQFGVELSGPDRAELRDWLLNAAADAPRRPVQLYHLTRIADAVDAPLPEGLAGHAQAWWREELRETSPPRNEEAVIEASYYVLLAERLGLELASQAGRLRAILAPERPVSTDPQTVSLVVRAWNVIDGPRADLDLITERIRSRQLTSGLFSSVQRTQGTLTSTFEVSRLRMVAGLPGTDARLREALDALRTTVLAKYDPLLRGAWLVLMDTTGGEVTDHERRAVVSAVKAAVPRSVDVSNVVLWNRYTEVLALLGEEGPDVSVEAWKADSPQHRYARSLLINGLHRADSLDKLPGKPRPADLVAEAEERLKSGTVRESAEALGAASALGWVPDGATAKRIAALLEARRTCPGAPTFYRDSAKDSECGVPGTRAGYRISALLEGAPTAGRTP